MEPDTTETIYTLVITGLKDDRARRRVADALVRVSTQLSADRVLERLDSLPWTVTRRATYKRASRLARLLEGLGAQIRVIPPLPDAQAPDLGETQIMPSAELLSDTQITSATQLIERPEETLPSEPETPVTVAPSPARPPEPHSVERAFREQDEFSTADVLPMEPLTVGGILDRTFQIARAYFWKLAAIVMLPALVAGAISLVGLLGALVVGFTMSSVLEWPVWVWVVGTIVLIPIAVVGIVVFVFLPQAALIYAISEICLGRDFRVLDAFRAVVQKVVPLALTTMLCTLALFGLILLTALSAGVLGGLYMVMLRWLVPEHSVWLGWLPAIALIPVFLAVPLYGWVKLSLFDKALVLEDITYSAALRRSWNLLSGRAGKKWYTNHVGRLGLLVTVFAVIQLAVSLLFQGPAVLFTYASHWQLVGNVATHVLSFCGNVIVGVFSATCSVLFYYDLRNRKEGLDLMLLAGETNEPQGD